MVPTTNERASQTAMFPPDLDTFFERAAKDVSAFLSAAETLARSPADASAHDLFALFAGKTRAERAMAALPEEPPAPHREAAARLAAMHAQARERYTGLVDEPAPLLRLAGAFGALVTEKTDRAGNLLADIRRVVQEDWPSGGHGRPEDGFRRAVEAFLAAWTDLAALHEALPPRLLEVEAVLDAWRRFQRLETAFRGCFGCFAGAEEILARFREREYGADSWWFTERPGMFSHDQLLAIGRWYFGQDAASACPDDETLYAYAAGEEEDPAIAAHVERCPDCRDMARACRESVELRRSGRVPAAVEAIFARAAEKRRQERDRLLDTLERLYPGRVVRLDRRRPHGDDDPIPWLDPAAVGRHMPTGMALRAAASTTGPEGGKPAVVVLELHIGGRPVLVYLPATIDYQAVSGSRLTISGRLDAAGLADILPAGAHTACYHAGRPDGPIEAVSFDIDWQQGIFTADFGCTEAPAETIVQFVVSLGGEEDTVGDSS